LSTGLSLMVFSISIKRENLSIFKRNCQIKSKLLQIIQENEKFFAKLATLTSHSINYATALDLAAGEVLGIEFRTICKDFCTNVNTISVHMDQHTGVCSNFSRPLSRTSATLFRITIKNLTCKILMILFTFNFLFYHLKILFSCQLY